jgi:hypothetical protein
LAGSEAAPASTFEAEISKADPAAAHSKATVSTFLLLSEFSSFGLKHFRASLPANRRLTVTGCLDLTLSGHDFALEYPHFHADYAISRVGLRKTVVDIRPQGV